MTVAELIVLLSAQDQEATVYVFGRDNDHGETHTENVNSIVSGDWGPQPFVIISSDEIA